MSFLYEIDKILRNMKVFKFVFTMVLLTYLISFALVPLFLLFDIPDMGGFSMDESNIELEFYLVVVIAPIIETFLFQTLFFWILLKIKFFQKNVILIIILSAAAFGICHRYTFIIPDRINKRAICHKCGRGTLGTAKVQDQIDTLKRACPTADYFSDFMLTWGNYRVERCISCGYSVRIATLANTYTATCSANPDPLAEPYTVVKGHDSDHGYDTHESYDYWMYGKR